MELSGAPVPCAAFACRARNLDELSRFSVLFSDETIIEFPLMKYIYDDHYDEYTVEDIICDIQLLYYIRPVVEASIIKFGVKTMDICIDCFENKASKIENF